MHLRTILIAVFVLAVSFAGATVGMQWLTSPGASSGKAPAVAAVPPLPPMSRASVIVAPVAITLTAIGDALEREAPREFSGKRDNPAPKLISNAEITWTGTRGPLAVSGRPDGVAVSSPVNGSLHVTGQLSERAAGGLSNAIGGILGGEAARSVERFATRPFDQRADIRGSVTVTAHPAILPDWRIEPNLMAQVSIADGGLSIAGMRLNVANEVKPWLDRSVNEQVAKLTARLRDNPFVETAARREWAKLCRSIPLGAARPELPKLWLEIRPVKAFAAQPRIDAAAVTLTIGVEAETRIVPVETKPDCPFPASLQLVPQAEQGQVKIAVPVDVPFTEVNRLIEARLTAKSFATDKAGVNITVHGATVVPSADRLLISLRLSGAETRSWFGLGGDATVHVWARPVLDAEQQVVRLADVTLDVESEAAFGLVGTATRAAGHYLDTAIAENAVIDLRPFAANARRSIETALADFRAKREDVRVDAAITELRLVGIAFDAATLRVVAEADGTAAATVSALPTR